MSVPRGLAGLSGEQTLADVLMAQARDRSPGVHVAEFQAGATLIHQDEAAETVWYLLKGAVRIVRYSADGAVVILAHRGPGDFLGEMALLNAASRSGTAVALGPVTAIALTRNAFIDRLDGEPMFASTLARQLALRVREASEQAYALVALPISARVAAEIFRVAGTARDGTRRPDANISITELAVRVNATRESVSKTLTLWRRQGLVSRDSNGWSILNTEALERHVEQRPGGSDPSD